MAVHGDQIYVDFVRLFIHENLYAWCLRYNICSAWFIDIRISTCFLCTWLLSYLYYTPFGIRAYEKCSVVKADRHNLNDRLAVSVKKYDVTIGHIPRKISCMCTLFIR